MWGSTGAMEIKTATFPNVITELRSGVLGVKKCEFVRFISCTNLNLKHKKIAKKMENFFKKMKVLLPDECISGIYEENGLANDIVHLLEDLIKEKDAIKTVGCLIGIHSSQLYHEISQTVTMLGDFKTYERRPEATIHTKYKTIA